MSKWIFVICLALASICVVSLPAYALTLQEFVVLSGQGIPVDMLV